MVVGDTNGTFSVENEVVLVVEGTANLLLDFEILRKEYLDPIIEYINGGPLQDSSCFFGNEYGPNQYCLVLFGTKSNEDAVQLVQYTRNVDELVKAIDNIRFTGGGAQEGSLLGEGLGFALQAFDDMKLRRQSANVQRNCIVVSNSPPYPQLTRECLSYQNKTVEQLAEMLAKDNINLSIISPRKLPGLQKVFDKSRRDDSKTAKDFAKDPRHLVCIQGLVLPGTQGNTSKSSPQVKSEWGMSHPSSAQPMSAKEPNTSPPKAANTISKGSPGSINNGRQMMPDQSPEVPKRVKKTNTNKSPPVSSGPDLITSNSNNLSGSQVMAGMIQASGGLRFQSPNAIIAPPNQVPVIPPVMPPDLMIGQQQPPQAPPEAIPPGGNQNQAWNGMLEWTETVKNEATQQPQKITRSLQCHISVVAPGNAIKTDKWPGKLIMQLIPQHLLSTLGPLLQNCKTVAFRFPATDPDSLKALYRVMALNGVKFAGCVHFAPVPGCDIKVLLLIYSPKKKAFVGLIPHDQGNFVNGIRSVLQKYRQDQFKKIQQQRLLAAQIRQQQQMQQTQQPGFQNQIQQTLQFGQQNTALQGTPMQIDPAALMQTVTTQAPQTIDGITSTQPSSIAYSTGSVGGAAIGTMTPTLPGIDQDALRLQALKQQQQQHQQRQQQQQLLFRQKLQQLQQQQAQQQQQQQQQFVQQQHQQQQQLQQTQPSQVQNQLRHLLQQAQNQVTNQTPGQQPAMTQQQWQQQQQQHQRALLLQQRQQQSQQQQQQQQQQQLANQIAQVQMSSAQLAQTQSQMATGQVSQAQMTTQMATQGLAQGGQQDFFPEKMSLLDLLQP